MSLGAWIFLSVVALIVLPIVFVAGFWLLIAVLAWWMRWSENRKYAKGRRP